MSYIMYFLQDIQYSYPQRIIDLLNSLNELSTVITLNKTPLLSNCPNTNYIERVDEDGSLEITAYMLKQIKDCRTELVILDHCFWNDEPVFLDRLLELKKEMNFSLVNLLHIDEYKFQKMEIVDRYYWPDWRAGQIWSWSWLLNDKKCLFYKFTDLIQIKGETIDLQSPQHSTELHKQVFLFMRLFNTIRLRNELDLFVLFLNQLQNSSPNLFLHRLLVEFRRFFRHRDNLKNDKHITPDIMNDLNETINKHVLYLALNDAPLFNKICVVFTDFPKIKID